MKQPYAQQGYNQAPPQQQHYQNNAAQQQVGAPSAVPEQQQALIGGNQRFAAAKKYNDWPWAVLFVLQFFFVIGLAVYYYEEHKHDLKQGTDDVRNDDGFESFLKPAGAFVGIFFGGGLTLSAGWLFIIHSFAHCLVWFSMLFSVACLLGLAGFLFYIGSTVGGAIMLIVAALNALVLYLWRHRIEFAAAMLTIVTGAIADLPANLVVSFGSIFVQAAWMGVWLVAAIFSLVAMLKKSNVGCTDDNSNSGSNSGDCKGPGEGIYLVYFFLLVSLHWGSQTVKNVVHTAVSGSLATWYFMFPTQMPSNPTLKSVKRSLTTSFGSICLGSLIVAIISAIRGVMRAGRRTRNPFIRGCVLCILGCIERIVQYFNVYAFTYVAIYGKTYCDAGKATWQLFQSKGISAIVNDDLSGSVLSFACFITGAIVVAATIGVGHFGYDMTNVTKFHGDGTLYLILWCVIGFLVGFVLCMCSMIVIRSGVATIFVCFAEDPQALADSKPVVYNDLVTAWAKRHGSCALAVARPPQQGYPGAPQQQQQQW